MTVAGRPARERWRRQLEAWALPDELLGAVADSPYEWPAELFKRRHRHAEEAEEGPTPTERLLERFLGERGTLLDVGAGAGRVSLPWAARGHPLTAVEKDAGMARAFREEAEALGVKARLVEERWPEAAGRVEPQDAVLCTHVVYDVQDIGPFVQALHERAGRGVVVELTSAHPWADLAPYYRRLHGLERPSGPTAEDLVEVIREEVGVVPRLERWRRGGQLWFVDRDELLAFYRRRLVLPEERTEELAEILEPEMVEREGRLFLGAADREMVTIWWEVA